MPSASPKLLSLNQEHSSKKKFFWLKSFSHYKIEVTTFLTEMLEIPDFGHVTTSTI